MNRPDVTPKQREARAQRADRERAETYKEWRTHMSKENVVLVDRIIRTLVDADFHGDPRRSSPLDGQRAYTRPDFSRDEGAATRWARDWVKRFHRVVLPTLAEFDARTVGEFNPVVEKPPMVRCRHRDCSMCDVGVAVWRDLRGGRRVFVSHCGGCGRPFSKEDVG